MEYRNLGNSGLKVPVLSLGTGTFGGTNEFFQRWGQTDAKEAATLIDICLDRGINFFDTACIFDWRFRDSFGQSIKGQKRENHYFDQGHISNG